MTEHFVEPARVASGSMHVDQDPLTVMLNRTILDGRDWSWIEKIPAVDHAELTPGRGADQRPMPNVDGVSGTPLGVSR